MADLVNLTSVLARATGLAIELWTSAGRTTQQEPWRSSNPALEALNERVQELATIHPEIARAIHEEELWLSVARELRRVMAFRSISEEWLRDNCESDPQELENALGGITEGTISLTSLARIAEALDAKVQVVLVPNAPTAQTEDDLADLVKDAGVLLAVTPNSSTP